MTNRRHILILGGASDIGQAIARRFAQDGYRVTLAARRPERLADDRSDIALRHDAEVDVLSFDVLDTGALAGFVESFSDCPDVVVSVVGAMGDHDTGLRDPEAAAHVMRTNFEGPAQVLGLFANRMLDEGGGSIVGISSVAGDRGRGSNYIYGSAKAGFTAWLSGLRNRLADSKVHVVTVKPGFVATQMTEGLDLPAALTAKPSEVGEAVLSAVRKRRDVVYVRPVWRFVMGIICALPEGIFKKTKL